MICSTSGAEGRAPPCVLAYACWTSAATAATSADDEAVLAASVIPGEDPLLESKQARNLDVSVLHSDQDASPGATTSMVRGLNSLMPPELSALMLLFSQPPGARFGPFASVWR